MTERLHRGLAVGSLVVVVLSLAAPAGAHYVGIIYYPPGVGDDGTLYVGGSDGILYALDGDGEPRWTYNASSELLTRARVADGTAVVGTIDGAVHAVRPNGSVAWTADVGETGPDGEDGPVSPVFAVTVGRDRVFAVTAGTVAALDRETGRERWRFVPRDQPSGVAVAGDRVYVVVTHDVTSTLYALTDEGERVWNRTFNGLTTGPSAAADGTAYLEAGGTLYALAPDGTRQWALDSGNLWRQPTVDGSRVVVGTFDGRVLAIEEGRIHWSYRVGEAVAPSVGPDGRVYAVTPDAVVAIDDGQRVWRTRIAGTVLERPTVVGDRVYIGTQVNRTYALSTDGSIVWIDRYATPFGYGTDLPANISLPSVLANATGTPTRVVPANVSPTPVAGPSVTTGSPSSTPLSGFGIGIAVVVLLLVAGVGYYRRSSRYRS